MIADILEAHPGSIRELAKAAGVSYDTLWAWKSGRRNPTPENLRKLADALQERSDRLRELAAELRRAAGE